MKFKFTIGVVAERREKEHSSSWSKEQGLRECVCVQWSIFCYIYIIFLLGYLFWLYFGYLFCLFVFALSLLFVYYI